MHEALASTGDEDCLLAVLSLQLRSIQSFGA